jgi:CheY-like chemotaxis protein
VSQPVGLNVLVAEDRADDAAALQVLLSRDGHRVRVAGDGVAALREVLDDPPEVLLLDINLPKLDGCDVAAAARSVAWHRRPLVVTVTGHDGQDYRRRAAAAGVDLYLVKPVDPEAIRAVLMRYRQGRRGCDGC